MNRRQLSNSQFINRLTEITEANLKDENFGVSELAREVGISRSNLYAKVKSVTNKSISSFIREVRLKKASELLKQTSLTVSEVAYEVGFGSPTYFIKCFHDYYGYPPGEVNPADQTATEKIETPVEEQESAKPEKRNKKSIALTVGAVIIIIAFSVLLVNLFSFKHKNNEKAIAVLPLKNLTGNPGNNYFVDGLHDAIIGELGQISSLRVISRTSTLRYRDSNMLMKDIANELTADIIMEGSVMGAGDSLRILVQLIDVFPKERHIFSKEYTDVMKNVLNVQAAAVKDIAQTTKAKLTKDEEQRLDRRRTVDPETYKAYLRGMYYIHQGTRESFDKGISYLNEAIKRDPGDPFAYAGLALGYATKGHGQLDSEESFLRAMSAAQKAIKLDPTIDEAYTALALLYLYDLWDWQKAKETFDGALRNNPNNAIANAHFAWYYVLFDGMEKSIYYAKKAVMIEPLSASYKSWLALLYLRANRYDEAEFWAKEALAMKKNIPYGNVVLGMVNLERGNYKQAIEYHEKLPESDYLNIDRVYVYVKAGERDKALALWNALKEKAKMHEDLECYLGSMATFLGYKEEAFHYLSIAVDKKLYPIVYFLTGKFSENLRDDPRYFELLKKLNLPGQKTIAASQ